MKLNPMPPGRKRLFWTCVVGSILLVSTGWILSLKSVLQVGINHVREEAGAAMDEVSQEIIPLTQEAGDVANTVKDISKTITEIREVQDQIKRGQIDQLYAEEEETIQETN